MSLKCSIVRKSKDELHNYVIVSGYYTSMIHLLDHIFIVLLPKWLESFVYRSLLNFFIHMFSIALSASVFLLLLTTIGLSDGLVRPQENEMREMKSLDGLWHFRYSPNNFTERRSEFAWFRQSFQNVSRNFCTKIMMDLVS